MKIVPRAQLLTQNLKKIIAERGLCRCGRPRDVPRFLMCGICRKKKSIINKKYRKRQLEKGLCGATGCGSAVLEDHTLCSDHLTAMNKRTVHRNKERREAGICRQCQGPLPLGRTALCLTCQPNQLGGRTAVQVKQEKGAQEAKNKAIRDQERLVRNHERSAVLPYLSSRDQQIVALRWGFDIDRDRTLAEVGRMFGITRERVRQIESEARKILQIPESERRLRPRSSEEECA